MLFSVDKLPSFVVPVALVFVALVIVASAIKGGVFGKKIRAKKLLTDREKAMFARLKECFPELHVLAQVSMGAVLTAKERGVRNRFDRKIIDFVLCSPSMEVLAVVELDDASHKTKFLADAARDKMLNDAGYKTLRFKNIPKRDELIAAMATKP